MCRRPGGDLCLTELHMSAGGGQILLGLLPYLDDGPLLMIGRTVREREEEH